MKWEKALTAEEGVFWVLNQAYKLEYDYFEGFIDFHAKVADFNVNMLDAEADENYRRAFNDQAAVDQFLFEIEQIYEALLNEIVISWDSSTGSSSGILDIEPPYLGTPDIYPKKCKVTKYSLANWFYHMGDIDKAKICYPAFDPQRDFQKFRTDLASISIVDKSLRFGSKSRNSYLRTIQAVADALLTKGLTGNDSGDARLILNKLSKKGKEAPLKERALANYLKEARELP